MDDVPNISTLAKYIQTTSESNSEQQIPLISLAGAAQLLHKFAHQQSVIHTFTTSMEARRHLTRHFQVTGTPVLCTFGLSAFLVKGIYKSTDRLELLCSDPHFVDDDNIHHDLDYVFEVDSHHRFYALFPTTTTMEMVHLHPPLCGPSKADELPVTHATSNPQPENPDPVDTLGQTAIHFQRIDRRVLTADYLPRFEGDIANATVADLKPSILVEFLTHNIPCDAVSLTLQGVELDDRTPLTRLPALMLTATPLHLSGAQYDPEDY
eukprot:3657900-Amphidinium_carterae.1